MSAHIKDLNSDHLRRLSGEVSRLANELSRLSTDQDLDAQWAPGRQTEKPPGVPVETVAAVIRARRLRERYFADTLFADPAWDMMLDLLKAELSGQRVSVSSLCAAAAVPPTTALRWLKTLVEQGLLIRTNDPLDGRRVYVELSRDASLGLRRYFSQIGNAPLA